jgi:hypothetical protein
MTLERPTDNDSLPAPESGTRKRCIIYMAVSFFATQGYAAFGTRILGLDAKISYAITLVLVSIQNFFFLMHYVYQTSHKHQWQQFMKFVHSVIGFRIWEYVLFLILHTLLGVHDQIAILIVQGQSVFLKATVYKKHVFRISDEELDPELTERSVDVEEPTLR